MFIKEVESAHNRMVPDFGAAGQVYVGQGFCELESMGELTDNGPATLTEKWTVQKCNDLDEAISLVVPSQT